MNSEIRVWIGDKGPVVSFGGNPIAGFDIFLNTQHYFWTQVTYQFAHELCHVLAQYQQQQHANQWFEEVLCEIASMYCLKRIAAACADGNPPHPSLNTFQVGAAPYFTAINKYADDLINDSARHLDGTINAWLRAHEDELRINPYLRDQTNIASNFLLPRVMNEPAVIASIAFLNCDPCQAGEDSLREYFEQWRKSTPEVNRQFIVDVIRLFITEVGE